MKASGNAQRREPAADHPAWEDVVGALGDLYRAQGYVVESGEILASGNSADGFDLKLRKDDHVVLIQCTQAGARQLPHNHVHRLLGAFVKQGATAAVLVTDGEFTEYARTSAAKLGHIQLIDGTQLQAMLGDAYAGSSHAAVRLPAVVLAAKPRIAAVRAVVLPTLPAADIAPPPGVPPARDGVERMNPVEAHDGTPTSASPAVPAVPRQSSDQSSTDAAPVSLPPAGVAARFRARRTARNGGKSPSRLTKPLAGVLACAIAMWTMQGAMGSFESRPALAARPVASAESASAASSAIGAPLTVDTVATLTAVAPVATAMEPGLPSSESGQPEGDAVAVPASAALRPVVSNAANAAPAIPDSVADPSSSAAALPSTPESATAADAVSPRSRSTAGQERPARVDLATIALRRAARRSAAGGVEDEVRAHERRNAEAMRVLEKNTPTIGYSLPDRSR